MLGRFLRYHCEMTTSFGLLLCGVGFAAAMVVVRQAHHDRGLDEGEC